MTGINTPNRRQHRPMRDSRLEEGIEMLIVDAGDQLEEAVANGSRQRRGRSSVRARHRASSGRASGSCASQVPAALA